MRPEDFRDDRRIPDQYTYGDYESLTNWLWIYGHVGIPTATAPVGYSVAPEQYLLIVTVGRLFRIDRTKACGRSGESLRRSL